MNNEQNKQNKQNKDNKQLNDDINFVATFIVGIFNWICRVATIALDITGKNFEIVDKEYLKSLQEQNKKTRQ